MAIRINNTRFVFFPVPKVACTSVKTGLLAHNDPAELARIAQVNHPPTLNIHMVYPTYPFKPWTPVARWPKDQWICLVRDPIKRAVSGYRNRILHHHDLEKSPEGALERLGLPTTPDLETFALNLAAYSSANKDVDHHFAPHNTFLGNRPERFAHVFKLSDIQAFKDLLAEAGAPLDIPHEQTGGPKVSVDDLSRKAREALENFYAKDYRAWGAYF